MQLAHGTIPRQWITQCSPCQPRLVVSRFQRTTSLAPHRPLSALGVTDFCRSFARIVLFGFRFDLVHEFGLLICSEVHGILIRLLDPIPMLLPSLLPESLIIQEAGHEEVAPRDR